METNYNSILSERRYQQFNLFKVVNSSRIHFHYYGYLKTVSFTPVSAQLCRVLIFNCNDQIQKILLSMNKDSSKVTKRIKQIQLVKISVSDYKYGGQTRQKEL
jgi:hypothetical protein